MKKWIFFASLLISISFLVSAQSPDDIVGVWKTGYENRKIQIFKRGDLYFGKLISIEEADDESKKPMLDVNNPDKKQQTQPIVGLEILKNFSYAGKGSYSKGKIYDIKSGNTYNGMIKIYNRNKLNIRSYLGLSIIGKTETWTKAE